MAVKKIKKIYSNQDQVKLINIFTYTYFEQEN